MCFIFSYGTEKTSSAKSSHFDQGRKQDWPGCRIYHGIYGRYTEGSGRIRISLGSGQFFPQPPLLPHAPLRVRVSLCQPARVCRFLPPPAPVNSQRRFSVCYRQKPTIIPRILIPNPKCHICSETKDSLGQFWIFGRILDLGG